MEILTQTEKDNLQILAIENMQNVHNQGMEFMPQNAHAYYQTCCAVSILCYVALDKAIATTVKPEDITAYIQKFFTEGFVTEQKELSELASKAYGTVAPVFHKALEQMQTQNKARKENMN